MAVGGVRIEWLGEQFAANTRAALAKGLTAGAIVVQNKMKANLSVKGGKTFAIKKGKGGGRGRVAKSIHSSPGEYPYQQTGNLRRSISHAAATPASLVAAAGVSAGAAAAFNGENVDTYALFLEFKSPNNGGRPFLIRSLRESQGEVLRTVIAVARNNLKAGGK